jgi:alpha-ribazole phosphatase
MQLLLTRHGETDWNAARRYQGQSDTPLNQTGIWQAEQIAKRLSKETIHAICASDLSRAAVTAQIIAGFHQLGTLPDPRWRELSFGKWEGLNHEEIEAGWRDEVTKWYADPLHCSPPDGERISQLAERVRSALNDLRAQYKDETVLVVSHGGVIQTLLCLLLGVDLKRYWQFHVQPASLTIVQLYDGNAILELFNDKSHLEGGA